MDGLGGGDTNVRTECVGDIVDVTTTTAEGDFARILVRDIGLAFPVDTESGGR